ncbi:hypothetical protein DV737_g1883, partial [Chaetothyriales sp. CBS 132003]
MAAPIPITILTGFLGAGKTTLILNLVAQLPATYRLALLKNEFGDVAVDSKLAAQQAISGTRELLNGCICCNLVGQLGDALFELRNMQPRPSRIVIETSGSAFPATLAMEVNRLIGANPATFVLDGVISVIDVENWTGYDDTSPTARMQARYTDLIVLNKWEEVSERRFDECLDRVGDLEVNTPWVKSDRGWVDKEVVMGVDGALIAQEGVLQAIQNELGQQVDVDLKAAGHSSGHGHGHGHEDHQDEVDVLSVLLAAESGHVESVNLDEFEELLLSAPKDEVYRIKGLIASTQPPPDSKGQRRASLRDGVEIYVLNWAFGRWTYTGLSNHGVDDAAESRVMDGASARLTFILARGEANKWKKKLEQGKLIVLGGKDKGALSVRKIEASDRQDNHSH